MEIKNTYPPAEKRHYLRQRFRLCCKWTFLFAGFLCATVNISTGGQAWSTIVIWSMWMVWTQLISMDMVEYNRISQTIKLIANACILLFLVDLTHSSGLIQEAVPIVGFSALILIAVLFFSNFEKQRQNMFPMLLFCLVCLIGAIIGLIVPGTENSWAFTVMGALALSLMIGCTAKLGKSFFRDCQKYFCTK